MTYQNYIFARDEESQFNPYNILDFIDMSKGWKGVEW